MEVNFLLFDGVEALDLFGPVEILAQVGELHLNYFSQFGGIVTNAQDLKVITEPISNADQKGILVVPGGQGTRRLVNDPAFLSLLKELADQAHFCLSICTGSALLAKCGALDGRKATSNKEALDWVKSVAETVDWVGRARWVVDGKYYTSSGVSAGMDMTLGFVSDQFGRARAEEIALLIEYVWNDNPADDQFAVNDLR